MENARMVSVSAIDPKEVTFTLTLEPEDCTPEDMFASGSAAPSDIEEDANLCADIRRRLERGDEWAWFCARVHAEWRGIVQNVYVGACSYSDEAEFKPEFEEMCREALDRLEKARDLILGRAQGKGEAQ